MCAHVYTDASYTVLWTHALSQDACANYLDAHPLLLYSISGYLSVVPYSDQ